MERLLHNFITKMRRVTPQGVGLLLCLVGVLDLALTASPGALAAPGGRVPSYLILAGYLTIAVALMKGWWKWCGVAVLLSALWLAYDDQYRGIVDRDRIYRLKEEGLIRMHERELRDLQAQWCRDKRQAAPSGTQPGGL